MDQLRTNFIYSDCQLRCVLWNISVWTQIAKFTNPSHSTQFENSQSPKKKRFNFLRQRANLWANQIWLNIVFAWQWIEHIGSAEDIKRFQNSLGYSVTDGADILLCLKVEGDVKIDSNRFLKKLYYYNRIGWM